VNRILVFIWGGYVPWFLNLDIIADSGNTRGTGRLAAEGTEASGWQCIETKTLYWGAVFLDPAPFVVPCCGSYAL
jgi:hypothetical protein